MGAFESKLKEIFEEDRKNLKGIFSQVFTHVCHKEFGNQDIYTLGKIIEFEQIKKIVEYYDGQVLHIPTVKQFNDCYFLTLCYFLKEEMNWDWKQIKETLGVSNDDEFFSTISLGKKILSIKDSFKKDLQYLLDNMDKAQVPQTIEEMTQWINKKKTL